MLFRSPVGVTVPEQLGVLDQDDGQVPELAFLERDRRLALEVPDGDRADVAETLQGCRVEVLAVRQEDPDIVSLSGEGSGESLGDLGEVRPSNERQELRGCERDLHGSGWRLGPWGASQMRGSCVSTYPRAAPDSFPIGGKLSNSTSYSSAPLRLAFSKPLQLWGLWDLRDQGCLPRDAS